MNNSPDEQPPLNGESPQVPMGEPALVVATAASEPASAGTETPPNTTSTSTVVIEQSVTKNLTITKSQQVTSSTPPKKRSWFRSNITGMVAIIIVLAALDIWIIVFQPGLRLGVWICYLVLLLSFII